MAIATELTCWEIMFTGLVKFRFRVRNDTSVPSVSALSPDRDRPAPTTATST